MTMFYTCCLGLLVFQTGANAAPNVGNEPTQPDESIQQTEKLLNHQTKLDTKPYGFTVENTKLDTQPNNQRKKRMFNDFAPPQFNFNFPSFSRNPYQQTFYNYEDPYAQIYRKLLEISDYVRQPPPPPVYHQYPIYLPVLFIPQSGCACGNGSNPSINDRFPDLDDKRQVWGVLINSTFPQETGDGSRPISFTPLRPIVPPTTSPTTTTTPEPESGGDGSRPISFEPIPPNRPLFSKPPPVEHGSFQAGTSSQNANRPQSSRPQAVTPSDCDRAIVSCCHQREITYQCFVEQQCPKPVIDADNTVCSEDIILEAIQKFEMYYKNAL